MVDQIEVPDGVRAIHLVGQDGSGNPYVVLVDTTGRLVAVIQGEISGITDNVTVEQDAKDREIQGADGATLRTVAVDASGQIIMVPRGQSGNYMDVDSSGYLTSVMKGLEGATLRSIAVDGSGHLIAVIQGDDGGTLRTAAVNADGRFQIVPHDPEDVWGNALGMGNAELAAILSPAKRFDRRGNVIYVNSFEHGLGGWTTNLQGAGAAIALTAVEGRTGAYSVKVTGGSDGAQFASMVRIFPYPRGGKVGLEVSFSIPLDVDKVQIYQLLYTGSAQVHGSIRYDHQNGKVEYLDSANAWQTLDAAKQITGFGALFSTVKLVINLTDAKYERALLNDEEYDMTGYAMRSVAAGIDPSWYNYIYCHSQAAQNNYIHIDDVILTQNEPAT